MARIVDSENRLLKGLTALGVSHYYTTTGTEGMKNGKWQKIDGRHVSVLVKQGRLTRPAVVKITRLFNRYYAKVLSVIVRKGTVSAQGYEADGSLKELAIYF